MLTSYFMKTTLYCLSLLFKTLSTPPPSPQLLPCPCHLQPSPPLFFLLSSVLWLNGLLRHIWYVVLFNYNMDLHMSSLGTLVPEGTLCVFYAAKRQVYWGLIHNVVFYWYSNSTSQNKHTQHTQEPVDWHNQINIYLHHLLCAHSGYLYYMKWIIRWYQKFTFYNVFSFQKLFTCKSHISVD